ncbi:FixH family protein [Craurococcus roseus]|uniref:FixH family protein n=1 Tax=Craurococcus roseus TaxID=77585 RepID=A0ABN1FJP9_9PROT
MTDWTNRACAAALAVAAALAPAAGALAAAQDYEFRLVTPEVKQGDGAVVAVRLVHKPSGRAVPNAVVYGTRLDMSPDNMPTMTMPLAPVPGGEPGVYRFRTNLAMAGGWALTLTAKVQGEEGTVENRLVFRATP